VNDIQAIDRTQALRAKVALEEVCSGARLAGAPEFYSSHFVDHVNGAEHRILSLCEHCLPGEWMRVD
jgi:hypothetical protein